MYNFSVARAVENLERAKIQPWRHKIDIVNDRSNYTLATPKPIDPEHDPSRYDVFPTDSFRISGQFFKTCAPVNGIGAPLVAIARSENPQFRQEYRLPGVYAPVTAAIRFSGRKAELEFVDPMKSDRIAVSKHIFPLAMDLNASTAMLIARERPERLGFARDGPAKIRGHGTVMSATAVRSSPNAGDFCSRLAGNRSELGPDGRLAPQ